MDSVLRVYREEDYQQCERLVNEAWAFDSAFFPRDLADLAKCVYTRGSVVSSNFRYVVEINNEVVGFIFGLNTRAVGPKRNLRFALGILWRLLRIKYPNSGDRRALLRAINDHQSNRYRIVGRGWSEVVLFVVRKDCRGLGLGKKLWSAFRDHCQVFGVESILVETNKLGASGFYEALGFRFIANFDSPLHEYVTKGGQACLYEYPCGNRSSA